MKRFSILVLLLICLWLGACESPNRPELYDFSSDFGEQTQIIRLTCHEIPSRIWWSEERLVSNGAKSHTLSGGDAQAIWKIVRNRQNHIGSLSDYRFTNEDYLVVAEDTEGRRSAVIIGQTFLRRDRRFLSCKNDTESWIADLDEESVRRLGIK